jgi:acetolactate synthase-1/3 small subunit
VRVNAEPQHRAEILRVADIFRAKVVDVTPTTFTLEATGEESKLNAIIELLRPMGIQELVRTGKVAIARGSKTTRRQPEEPLGKSADAQRRRRDVESSPDPRVAGFVD